MGEMEAIKAMEKKCKGKVWIIVLVIIGLLTGREMYLFALGEDNPYILAVWAVIFAVLVLIVVGIRAAVRNSGKKTLAAFSEAELARLNQDCTEARRVKNAVIARDGILIFGSTGVRAVPMRDIVWIHGRRNVTTYMGAIPLQASYQILIYTLKRKIFTIKIGNKIFSGNTEKWEAISKEFFDRMAAQEPWILYGHTPELQKMYRKDFVHMVESVTARWNQWQQQKDGGVQ